MSKVYNKKTDIIPPDAVYVGRPTKFGNPYPMGGPNGFTREEAIANYRRLISHDPHLQEQVKRELKGKDLVCWCAPLACHADILMEIANECS